MLKTYLCSLQSRHYHSHEQFVTCGPLPDPKFFRSIENIFSLYIFTLLTFECSITVLAAIYCNEDFSTACCLLRHCTLVYVAELWTGTCRSLLSVTHSGEYVRTCDIPCTGAFRACWIACRIANLFVGTLHAIVAAKARAKCAHLWTTKKTSIPTLLKRAVRQLFSLE